MLRFGVTGLISKIRKSLIYNLMFVVLTVLLIPIAIISLVAYRNLESNTMESYEDETAMILLNMESNLVLYFKELSQITTNAFFSADVQEILSDQTPDSRTHINNIRIFDSYVYSTIADRNEIVYFAIITGSGVIYDRDNRHIRNKHIIYNEVVEILNETQFQFNIIGIMSTTDLDTRVDTAFITARNIADSATGAQIGNIIIGVNPSVFYEFLGYYNDDSDVVAIVDSNGNIAYDSSNRRNISLEFGAIYPDDGSHHVMEHYSERLGLTFVRRLSFDKMYASLSQIGTMYIILAIGCFIVFGFLVVVLTRRITKPITALAREMESVTDSGFSNVITETSVYNEISTLENQYNAMLFRIKELLESERAIMIKKAESEYRALQMQITPHFLFNSLESIHSLAILNENNEISSLIHSLSNVFKYNMDEVRYVVLHDEIMHIKDYIDLQGVCYQSRYVVELDIPEKYYNAPCIKFALQPLIENAIKHGMKSAQSGGRIWLEAGESLGALEISVNDNGDGIDQIEIDRINALLSSDVNNETNAGAHQIGLFNVNLRLKLSFGEKYGLKINHTRKGFSISMFLPFATEGSDDYV